MPFIRQNSFNNVCLTSLAFASTEVGTGSGCAVSNFEFGLVNDNDWYVLISVRDELEAPHSLQLCVQTMVAQGLDADVERRDGAQQQQPAAAQLGPGVPGGQPDQHHVRPALPTLRWPRRFMLTIVGTLV